MASPPRKLTKEEDEAVTQRLFYQQAERARTLQQKRQATLEAGVYKQEPLSKETTESLVHRIYEQQMEKKKRLEEEHQKKREALAAPVKTMTQDDMSEMVKRMYYQQQERTVKTKEHLRAKYQPETEKKRLTKEQQDECGNRLFKGSKARKEEIRKKIFDQYVAPMDPPNKKITKEQMKAMGERLCTTKT